MISQIFILSERGDVLINRDLRGDLIKETPEIFFRHIKLSKTDPHPIFNLEGINYLYSKKHSIYLVATTRFNSSPSLILETLQNLSTIIKDFCGILTEESIRKNFVLVYEIIDEILDFGYPQLTSTDLVKDYIVSTPISCDSNILSGLNMNIFKGSTKDVKATHVSVANSGKKNEIFVDVVQNLHVLFNSSNIAISGFVNGGIRMKSYLSGSPTLVMNLNIDSYFTDFNFHECVNDSDFNFNRKLSISPPGGEFSLMNFRLNKDIEYPFRIYPNLTKESSYKFELNLKIQCEIEKGMVAKQVTVCFRVPETTSSVYLVLKKEDKNQKMSYDENEKKVNWKIQNFKGGAFEELSAKIVLKEDMDIYRIKKELGPVNMGFEINQQKMADLKIKSLTIQGTDNDQTANKWVRYITTAKSYVMRI